MRDFCNRVRRREFIHQLGGGFTSLALAGMLSRDRAFADELAGFENPLAPREPQLPAKAKAVIFLFMYGGPSHIDTFDYKPKLYPLDGKTIPVKTFGRGGKKNEGRVVGPKWEFSPRGECGKPVSTLFPHVGDCVDDIAFVHSMTADSPIHGSAMLMMNSGSLISGKPSLGSWVNYGLGSLNENLPGYVVMLDKTGGPISGAKNWSSGFMPASYQGVVFRSQGSPILNLSNQHGMDRVQQRSLLDFVGDINRGHLKGREHNSDLAARIASYELAYRMQATAPEAIDVDSEPKHIKSLYGMDEPRTDDFARKCILARRLVERGVRFIQIYSGGAHNDANWDAHGDLVKNHEHHAGNTDKPIAGLLKDLKQRGLLDETLVVWGGEFGRQPTAEYAKGTGRDHNSYGFTQWIAGGGIKGGISFGETDELGAEAVKDRVQVKHLHATILHQMGLDPNALTYFYGGLDHKLVGVEGAEPIHELIA
ncbi:DUF1501 domain-containing protein [Haloferula sp. A504]|uniref:DUF1501 domain-containing protein n=1 Tax=Haloferula sp. A504 TaxID=3373601 RepID=UPI0031C88258|nr:DUF1501 domain-containing protein [Verrucomicrobiaceae bacterium E54]